MKIVRWEINGELYVGIDEHGWKRAVIMPEGSQHYGVYPLGLAGRAIEEIAGTNLRTLKRRIAAEIREIA
jgi:hypothetical protein